MLHCLLQLGLLRLRCCRNVTSAADVDDEKVFACPRYKLQLSTQLYQSLRRNDSDSSWWWWWWWWRRWWWTESLARFSLAQHPWVHFKQFCLWVRQTAAGVCTRARHLGVFTDGRVSEASVYWYGWVWQRQQQQQQHDLTSVSFSSLTTHH